VSKIRNLKSQGIENHSMHAKNSFQVNCGPNIFCENVYSDFLHSLGKLVDCSDPASEITGSSAFQVQFHDPSVNHPPTPVGGIPRFHVHLFCRWDLNHPPTSVGGIPRFHRHLCCRLDLNNPPTSVGGIQENLKNRGVDYLRQTDHLALACPDTIKCYA
jgi:hypothetical protein